MPPRMFSVEGMMGLRSWRDADGTAILRAVVAASSSIADGVASALKPRRTSSSPYPAAATARATIISKTAFQGFMSTLLSRAGTTNQESEFYSVSATCCDSKILMGNWLTVECGCRVQKQGATIAANPSGSWCGAPIRPREPAAGIFPRPAGGLNHTVQRYVFDAPDGSHGPSLMLF